jgi:hypothetical protein
MQKEEGTASLLREDKNLRSHPSHADPNLVTFLTDPVATNLKPGILKEPAR